MKMHKLARIFSIFSAIYLSAYMFSALLLGWVNPSFGEMGDLLFTFLYCCALTPLSALSSIGLVWVNRTWLSNTFVWAAFQLVFIMSMGMDSLPVFGLFFTNIQMLLTPLLLLVNFLYAYQKRSSLVLLGWSSIGIVWSILLTWGVTGNIIEKLITLMGTDSHELWWSQAFLFGFISIFIGGLVGFVVQTFQIVRHEFSD